MVFIGRVQAGTATWTGHGSSANFLDAANWEGNAPPGRHAGVDFSGGRGGAIGFAGDVEVGGVHLRGEGPTELTLDLGGHELVVGGGAGDDAEGGTLAITAAKGRPRTLEIRGGTLRLGSFTLRGEVGGAAAVLLLADRAVLAAGTGMVGFDTGLGEVHITDGARWLRQAATGWAMSLGHWQKAEGRVVVRGAGSVFESGIPDGQSGSNVVIVGHTGRGEIRIEDGGRFAADIVTIGGTQFADGTQPQGRVGVLGAGAKFSARRLYVGGGLLATGQQPRAAGPGEFLVADGAVADAGSLHVLANAGAGTFGRVVLDSGTLRAGAGDGAVGPVIFAPNSQLVARIAGAGQAPMLEAGDLRIHGARLAVEFAADFQPGPGDVFAIADYRTIDGEFIGFRDGETYQIGGREFIFRYRLDGADRIGLVAR